MRTFEQFEDFIQEDGAKILTGLDIPTVQH